MLLAIDAGNTQIVFCARVEDGWRSFRIATRPQATEDELAAVLLNVLKLGGIDQFPTGIVIASVVPPLNETFSRLAAKWLGCKPLFVTHDLPLGITIAYDPPSAVGADRLANAVAAESLVGSPAIVVDFGTAVTLDVVSSQKEYLGGSILPGIYLALESLAGKTSKLPAIDLSEESPQAIGKTTPESLRSGVLLGTAGAVESLIGRIKLELGGDAAVVATGGLATRIAGLCPSIHRVEPHLTLDGLRIIHNRMKHGEN